MGIIIKKFKASFTEFSSIKSLATIGIFIALFVVLDAFCTVKIGAYLKIGFAFLPLAVIGMLFGPAVGLFAGFACDLVGFLANPVGGFIPALALVTALEGMIYGILLYNIHGSKSAKVPEAVSYVPVLPISKKKLMVNFTLKTILARTIVVVVCNMLLNTVILYSMGFLANENGFFAVLSLRIFTNLISLPIGLIMLTAVLTPVKLAYNRFYSKKISIK